MEKPPGYGSVKSPLPGWGAGLILKDAVNSFEPSLPFNLQVCPAPLRGAANILAAPGGVIPPANFPCPSGTRKNQIVPGHFLMNL